MLWNLRRCTVVRDDSQGGSLSCPVSWNKRPLGAQWTHKAGLGARLPTRAHTFMVGYRLKLRHKQNQQLEHFILRLVRTSNAVMTGQVTGIVRADSTLILRHMQHG